MTLTLENIVSRGFEVPEDIKPSKPKPGWTPVEWREYFRRVHIKMLRHAMIRREAGWTDSAAEHWLLTAEIQLTRASIRTRTNTERFSDAS